MIEIILIVVVAIAYVAVMVHKSYNRVEEEVPCIKEVERMFEITLVSGTKRNITFVLPEDAEVYIDGYKNVYRMKYRCPYDIFGITLKYGVIDFIELENPSL